MFDDDHPHDECGVFGIFAPGTDVARLGFFALYALQHRGQEAAGLVTYDGTTTHEHLGKGLVSQVFDEASIERLKGDLAIGHTRYSTTGGDVARNYQPYLIETIDGPLAVAHNGNLVNAAELRQELLQRGIGLSSTTDTEVMVHLLVGGGRGDWVTRLRILMAQAEGAYTLSVLTRDAIYGVRDPWGLRPLALGRLVDGGGYVLASETCAFDVINAELVQEIGPGQIVKIDAEGYSIIDGVPPRDQAFCTFEQIYFARPDSEFAGQSIHTNRQAMGRQLAIEAPADADAVMCVPDSAEPHALGYAHELGLPTTTGLIKNRYIGRTFIQPTEQLRRDGVAMKFNPLPDNLRGKRIVMVDDSIVRGTTSGPLVKMLRKAGASEVHVRVASPPIKHPCFMGVDMAAPEDLIANNKTVEEIREHIGADSLAFLSQDGLMTSLEATDGYCNACFSGVYPFSSINNVEITTKKQQFAGVISD